MLTIIIVLLLATSITFFLMKKGKIADTNHNNIPDAFEKKVDKVVVEVKKVKELATKKPTVKTGGKNVTKVSKKEL